MTAPQHDHPAEELCDEAVELYADALRSGHVPAARARTAPCLLDLSLLHPSAGDPGRLEPVAPAAALHRMLRVSGERIARERRREEQLAETFRPLIGLALGGTAATAAESLRVISGRPGINQAIGEAMENTTEELLAVQPRTGRTSKRGEAADAIALPRDQALLDRGARIRTLYQHTLRHFPSITARYESLRGDVEARTLDEVTERLIVLDRTVAFIPANSDQTLALEIRHPAIVEYFGTVFDRLWRLASPMHPRAGAVEQPARNGVTPRQRAIAQLLTEGHTDAVIAERLGMNIRTARVHIAKLAATLGSSSRAQLGYLIARSGILDPEA
ncbi:response regulator transcription factor [Streptomyces sp. SID8111]|uniref:helix-turn-helix transcriptional regulator n=1 Tax=Streptomyces sp. SID8111 TaxID=2706100 RepID=UPI0013BFA678|nr:LuxR C-terminal-related transcriptional regulator [Streptomyces sp. SID8111]NEC27152.1 response regulator transcription factor [Streptomyces sp. SID8111]